ncbi:MAG: ion transporter [Ruminococcus flavefaciens]|nr:ion transporter [Ruminococcus flavefaciens]
MRKKLYNIISSSDGSGKLSSIYDIFMIIVIIISIVPIAFKEAPSAFNVLDKICVAIFIIDYLLRWVTADYNSDKNRMSAFLLYPFTLMAVIDLISILPSLTILNQGFKLLRLLRMFRALRVFRAFKLLRYSKNAMIIMNVFKRQKHALSYVMVLAIAYIVISALIVFNVEPDSFNSFFDAIYWATVSLTTVGYGDIYPVTTIGRIITMISSLFGIAIIALPAGIITAGYMDELHKLDDDADK